ncbi:hypothetical protein JCM3766R1_005114 [Sporobolomyces carnicolor]
MSSLFAEPVSPVLDFDDDQEPELEGLRNLSVSTDGTLDTLDENPTPPHSPTPIVHITPPGAKFLASAASDGRVFTFDDSVFDKVVDTTKKKPTLEPIDPRAPMFLPSLPSYSDAPPTPDAVRVVFPAIPHAPPQATETLAERRASLGKLSNRALLSLQQMRFESSDDAGMGLGVGPPSAGLPDEGLSLDTQPVEAISPGTKFQLALRIDHDQDSGRKSPSPASPLPKSPLLAAPGIENYDGATGLRRSRSTGSLRQGRRARSRSANRPYSIHSPTTSPAPSSPRAPVSPVIKRSSAFATSTANGPLTPLTPSHVPGAPSLGNNGGSAFEYFSFSAPESPVSPSFPPSGPAAAHVKLDYQLPLTPTSDSGSITPTGGIAAATRSPSSSQYYHRGGGGGASSFPGGSANRFPASPLGRGRFDDSAAEDSTGSNPFFAPVESIY